MKPDDCHEFEETYEPHPDWVITTVSARPVDSSNQINMQGLSGEKGIATPTKSSLSHKEYIVKFGSPTTWMFVLQWKVTEPQKTKK